MVSPFKVLVSFFVITSVKSDLIKDNIETIKNLLVSFNTALTVNAFVCWETGEYERPPKFLSQDESTSRLRNSSNESPQ